MSKCQASGCSPCSGKDNPLKVVPQITWKLCSWSDPHLYWPDYHLCGLMLTPGSKNKLFLKRRSEWEESNRSLEPQTIRLKFVCPIQLRNWGPRPPVANSLSTIRVLNTTNYGINYNGFWIKLTAKTLSTLKKDQVSENKLSGFIIGSKSFW